MGLIGSVVGGLASSLGSFEQTRVEREQQRYEEALASQNYHLATQAGVATASDIRSQSAATVSTQAARTKAGGVTLEGTPLQVMADTAAAGELKAQRALYASHVIATRYGDQAAMSRYNQYFLRWNQLNRARGAFFSSFGNSGGYQHAGQLYQNFGNASGRSLLGG